MMSLKYEHLLSVFCKISILIYEFLLALQNLKYASALQERKRCACADFAFLLEGKIPLMVLQCSLPYSGPDLRNLIVLITFGKLTYFSCNSNYGFPVDISLIIPTLISLVKFLQPAMQSKKKKSAKKRNGHNR